VGAGPLASRVVGVGAVIATRSSDSVDGNTSMILPPNRSLWRDMAALASVTDENSANTSPVGLPKGSLEKNNNFAVKGDRNSVTSICVAVGANPRNNNTVVSGCTPTDGLAVSADGLLAVEGSGRVVNAAFLASVRKTETIVITATAEALIPPEGNRTVEPTAVAAAEREVKLGAEGSEAVTVACDTNGVGTRRDWNFGRNTHQNVFCARQ
jgi:hypothetical protein